MGFFKKQIYKRKRKKNKEKRSRKNFLLKFLKMFQQFFTFHTTHSNFHLLSSRTFCFRFLTLLATRCLLALCLLSAASSGSFSLWRAGFETKPDGEKNMFWFEKSLTVFKFYFFLTIFELSFETFNENWIFSKHFQRKREKRDGGSLKSRFLWTFPKSYILFHSIHANLKFMTLQKALIKNLHFLRENFQHMNIKQQPIHGWMNALGIVASMNFDSQKLFDHQYGYFLWKFCWKHFFELFLFGAVSFSTSCFYSKFQSVLNRKKSEFTFSLKLKLVQLTFYKTLLMKKNSCYI